MSNYKKNFDLTLILLAIFCQFFSCTGLYFIRSYAANQTDPSSMLTTLSAITSTFLFSWFTFSFIGRLSGAYFFGKYAEKVNFFNVIRLVTIGHIFVAVLIAMICIAEEDFYDIYYGFYLARFFYSSLVHVTIILPAVYLLDRYPKSQHILISTYIALAMFLGKLLAYTFSCYIPSTHMQVWYWLPVAVSFLALGFYAHVEKHAQDAINTIDTFSEPSSSPIHKKILGVLIGGACNAGIYYYYFFLTPYLADIAIVQTYGLLGGQTPFYTAFGMFLLPAAKICKKFGESKIMMISLIGMLILGVSIPFMPISDLAYIIPQITFAFFLAGFVAPSLAVLYQLFKNTKNIFDTVFWFSLGSSICMLCLGVGSRIGFALNYPLTGMLIFAVNIGMCLIGIFKYGILNKKETLNVSLNSTRSELITSIHKHVRQYM